MQQQLVRRGVALAVIIALAVAGWASFSPSKLAPPSGRKSAETPLAPLAEPAAVVPAARETLESSAVAAGSAPSDASLPESTTPVDRTLAARHGRLVDAESGRPLVGAPIFAVPSTDHAPSPSSFDLSEVVDAGAEPLARSDAAGEFTLTYNGGSELQLALHDGFERCPFSYEWLSSSTDAPRVIALQRAARLLARAEGASGEALPGVEVALTLLAERLPRDDGWSRLNHASGDLRFRGTTDHVGRVELHGVPPGVPWRLEWRARGAAASSPSRRDPVPLVLAAGETAERTWRLGGGARILGRALDQHGAPLVAHGLWLTRTGLFVSSAAGRRGQLALDDHGEIVAATTTDDAGRFAFDDVDPGTWWIGPSPLGTGDVAPIAQRCELLEGQLLLEIDLVVERGLYIEGQVVDRQGRGVQTHVWAVPLDRDVRAVAQVRAGVDGGFTIGPLAAGRFRMMASSTDDGSTDSDWIEWEAGRPGLRLTLGAGGGLSVRCVDRTGRELPEAAVVIGDGAGGLTISRGVGEGGMRFGGVAPGRVTVAASLADGRAGLQVIDALAAGETRDVVVVLEEGALLRVRYDGDATERLHLEVRRGDTPWHVEELHGGGQVLLALPSGQSELHCRFGPRSVLHTVDLAAGTTSELRLSDD